MNRRYFIQATGASTVAVFAGCSGLIDNPNSTGTESDKHRETATNTATRTPSPVKQAITNSRQQLNSALTSLNNTDVIEDGEIGIATSDNFQKYRNTNESAVLDPAREARKTLKGVQGQATGERAATVKVLIGISAYTEGKWNEYTEIVRAFNAFGVTLSSLGEGNARVALDAAQDAVKLLTNVTGYQSELSSMLQRIRTADGEPGLEAWHSEREANEQDALQKILHEMVPTFKGLRAFVTGATQAGRAASLTQDEKYTKAKDLATSARANMDAAMAQFERALNRNVRYYKSEVTTFDCQATGFYDVLATLVDAIEAYRGGEQNKGDKLLADYRDQLDQKTSECQSATNGGIIDGT